MGRTTVVVVRALVIACMLVTLGSCSALPFLRDYRGYYVGSLKAVPSDPGPSDLVRIHVSQVADLDPNGVYPAMVTLPNVAVSAGTLYKVPFHEVPAGWERFDEGVLAANLGRIAELERFAVGSSASFVDSSGVSDYLIWQAPPSAQQVSIAAGYSQNPLDPGYQDKNGKRIDIEVR